MSKNVMPGVDSKAERATFGRNLQEARTKMGISQRDIHHETGVAQSHISQIETGTVNLSIDTMVKLAAITNMPLWKLLKP